MTFIRFVYFDIGGVAFRWRQALKALAQHVNRSEQDIWKVFMKYDESACRGKLTSQELWNNYKKELQLETPMDDFSQWWSDQFIPIAETHVLMKDTLSKYPIGLLTNIYEGTVAHMIHDGVVPDIAYTTIIQSCDTGLVKPEREIFIHAKNQTNARHEEIFFVDDNEGHIKAAQKLGWQTLLFKESDPHTSAKKIRKILHVDS